jgi:hypothetical protein
MSRPRVSVPIDAIRIEDEVWQDAFALAQDVAARRRRRLHALDGGRSQPLPADDVPRVRPAPADATPVPVPAAMPAAARAAVAQGSPAAAADAPPAVALRDGAQPGGRRTVTIRGYGVEPSLPWTETTRRRPQRPVHERAGFRPDRLAMWAVVLGVLLLLVAVLSAHG